MKATPKHNPLVEELRAPLFVFHWNGTVARMLIASTRLYLTSQSELCSFAVTVYWISVNLSLSSCEW